MASSQLERARRLLCSLQDTIRDALVAAQARPDDFARPSAVTRADTICAFDRTSEHTILAWFDAHWPAAWPVELVIEGCEGDEPLTFPRGTPITRTAWKCLLDPIDGPRGYRYDKRAAWSLAALAPQRGAATDLSDILVAAMTELPTRKQWRADQFSAVRGCGPRGLVATAHDLIRGGRRRLSVQPSRARTFDHGFASFARFFREGKAFTAELEEQLWRALSPATGVGPAVFDDQYSCTGGQLAEIICGHDRMVADLRAMVFAKLRLNIGLACHPYDVCTALVAREAGVIVEAPDGGELRGPLDTTTPVSWIAYANPALARLARPVFQKLIIDRL